MSVVWLVFYAAFVFENPLLVSDRSIGVYSYVFNSKDEADNDIFQTVTFDDLLNVNKIKSLEKDDNLLCRQPVSKTPNSYSVCYAKDIISFPDDILKWLAFDVTDEQKLMLDEYDKVADIDYSERRSMVVMKQIAVEIARAISIPVVLLASFFTFIWIVNGFRGEK